MEPTRKRRRYACAPCEVLQTADFRPVCFCCGVAMIPATQLPPSPTFVPYRNEMLTHREASP